MALIIRWCNLNLALYELFDGLPLQMRRQGQWALWIHDVRSHPLYICSVGVAGETIYVNNKKKITYLPYHNSDHSLDTVS